MLHESKSIAPHIFANAGRVYHQMCGFYFMRRTVSGNQSILVSRESRAGKTIKYLTVAGSTEENSITASVLNANPLLEAGVLERKEDQADIVANLVKTTRTQLESSRTINFVFSSHFKTVWIWNLDQWRKGKKNRQMVVSLLETRQLIDCESKVRSYVELT